MVTTLTRPDMEQKLNEAFPPEQTTKLVDILDSFRQIEFEQAVDMRDLKQGVSEISAEVKKLIATQQRNEERIEKSNRRTDQSFAEMNQAIQNLTAAQQRTDERLEKLSQRTDERIDKLSRTLDNGLTNLRQAVGSLANRFGFDLENFVAALLPPYLERHYGISGPSPLRRHYFKMEDDQQEEVDLVGEGQIEGRSVTLLVECRATVGGSEIRRLAQKLDTIAAAALAGQETIKIVVAMNLHPTGQEAAVETGIWAIPYGDIDRDRAAIKW